MGASSGTILWLTGLPSAGKTTLAYGLRERLADPVVIFDGDEVRRGLSDDLGFTREDRQEQARRVVHVACLAASSGALVVVALVSPYAADRKAARALITAAGHRFAEVFVDCPLDDCIERDVKGLYAHRSPDMTGTGAPYEAPTSPDVHVRTDREEVSESVVAILGFLGKPTSKEPHLAFIGRWCPFHVGHWHVMQRAMRAEPGKPLLIFVRDTGFDEMPAPRRKAMLEHAFSVLGVRATVQVVPDLSSVNWGRGVGWTPREITADEDMTKISATRIRQLRRDGDPAWRAFVAPGVADFFTDQEMT